MIVAFPDGVPVIGLPRTCPGAPPDESEGEAICFAELYEGRAQVLRHLSGPRVANGEAVRLTAHARLWRPGMRMLVATVPFRDGDVSGQFAWYWRVPEADGDFCVPAEELREWEQGALRQAFEAGDRRRLRARGYRERVSLRCIGE